MSAVPPLKGVDVPGVDAPDLTSLIAVFFGVPGADFTLEAASAAAFC